MKEQPCPGIGSLPDMRTRQKRHRIFLLLVTVAGTVSAMTLFELARHLLIPNVTAWQSHFLTISFSTVAVLFAAYFITRRSDRIIQRISDEIAIRKQTEMQLRLSEEKLSKIFQANPDWIIISSLYDGEYIAINDAVCRISGYSREEIQGHTSLELNIWVDPDERKAMVPILLKEGRISNHEVRFRMKSGKIRYMLRSAELIDLDGKAALISVCKDITDRKQTEDILRRFELLVQYSRDIIFFLRREDGHILEANEAATRAYGYSHEQLLNMTIFQLRAPEMLDMLPAQLAEADLHGVLLETLHLRSNGCTFPVEVSSRGETIGGTRILISVIRDISARKNAEEELTRTRDLLAQTSRMARVGGWEKYQLTGENRWSEITREILEVPPDFQPRPGNSVNFYEDGPDREKVREVLARAVQTGEPFDIEIRIITAKGNKRWVRRMGQAEFKEGICVRLYGTLEDIDARKNAEIALSESEQRLHLLVKNSSDSLVILNADGTQRYVSPAAERITGFSIGELEGRSLDTLIHPDDMADIRTAWRETVEHPEKTVTVQYRHIHKTKGWVFSEAIAQSFLDEPAIHGVIASVRDITAHKKAEEALQLSQKRLRLFLDASPNMYYLKDPSLRYLLINEATTRYFHRPEDEILGRTDSELILDETTARQCEATDLQAMQQKQTVMSIENFGDRFFETQKFPVLVNNEACGVAGIIRDITESKKLQMQLTQAQKMESVGRLAGGVAHDFNNMLGVILGHTEMALTRLDSADPLYSDLQEINKAATRSADLTRQLLAFARKQTVDPKILDLNETVGGMITMLWRLIGEDITLSWLPGKDLWPVRIDPSQVDQILANLCVNARDAITGVGKITIETETAVLDDTYCVSHVGYVPGEYVVLIVSDNGCGMDKNTLAHLFEPFFTTKEIGKGTGLGLATIYGIIKQNYGFINVYSEPGKGTVIRIYLPRHAIDTSIAQKVSAPVPALRGSETILLVEDEPMILEMTTSMLISQGYHVLPAATPGEAIRLVKQYSGPIHLLITDVIMPEMNGRELARILTALIPGLNCLFMSGYTANVIAHHGVLDQGVHFIQKPFTLERLMAQIQKALAQKAA